MRYLDMDFKNSQILAAVVSEWARPAISQVAAGQADDLAFVAVASSHDWLAWIGEWGVCLAKRH